MANKTFNDVKLNMTLKVQNTRANLSSSKEDMAVQMGKIQKWYTDFTPLVFSKKKVDGVTFDQDIIHYATCSTAASTTSKIVNCTGFNLVTGAWIAVRFTVTNTGAVGNLTLNVNNTGAKNIKYRNANLSSAGVLAANRTYMFVYDGTYYQLIGDLDTNTDHITTATTSGSGNAVTAITADENGALTVTKGSTFSLSTHTHSEYIPLTGSSAVTGNLEITKATGATGFFAKRSDTGARVFFGVGGSGTAEGIYSYTSTDWVFKHDSGDTSIPRITGGSITIGGITVPTSTGSFLVTGNTSYTATVTSSTSGSYTIGTLKIGGTDKTIYGKDTVYTHPSNFTAKTTAGFYKYTVNTNGHVTAGAALAKSDITALGISASDHTHSNYLGATIVSGNSYYGMAEPDGTDTEWIRTTSKGIIPYQSGSHGDGHAQLGTSTWYFSSSYIDNMYSGCINVLGDLPYLRFQQTTSDSEYDNANAGIKCYPAGTTGMNMTIQSGGNVIIGGGEFPTNFYNATKFAAEGYSDAGEKTYIGSDNTVYVITNGNTIEDRKVFIFGANFVLAAGGNLVFRHGTYDSYTSNTLTSAATTTARTWTLPDKTGTIALTSDLVDTKVTQSAATGNNYRPLIMGSKYSSTAGASTLQDTVTDQVYTNASLYANPSTGTIYGNHFNGQSYWLRHCYCFDDTSDFANYAWHKVASIKSTLTYSDHFITFLVKEKYSASYSNAGILRCRFRTSGSRVKEHVSLTWDYLISGATPSDGTAFTGNAFNTANFVAVWTNTASTSCELEIWVKLINRYSCITFTVLDESRRNSNVFYEDWTLYDSTGHGSSIYTTGTGHITSSTCELFGMVSHRELNTTLADYVKQDSQSEDSWHSLATTGFTSSSIQYRKYGSIVEITGNFRYTGTTSAFSNFATLPSDYRPKLQRQLVFPVCPVGGSGAAAPNAMLQIGTDGTMSLLSNNGSTFNDNTWIFNIMFIM